MVKGDEYWEGVLAINGRVDAVHVRNKFDVETCYSRIYELFSAFRCGRLCGWTRSLSLGRDSGLARPDSALR